MKRRILRLLYCCIATAALVPPVFARVDRVEVLSRSDVFDGQAFGAVGAYEKLICRVHFKVKPEHPRNQVIVDLDLAPRDSTGEVSFDADLYLLRPKQGGNGTVLLEIPNRGGKGMLALFNSATGSLDPVAPEHFGNGFLMRHGFTVAWLGWQADVREQPGLMRLQAPIARMPDGKKIRGLARSDFSVDEKRADHPLAHLIVGNIGGTGYPVADPAATENVLTVRETAYGPRSIIPRSRWSFARDVDNKPVADPAFVRLEGGFQPGKIYEVVYVAEDPRVVGTGLAAVRDLISHLKHHEQAPVRVRRAYGFGISQSGRFLRHFLYQGFNADEEGRQVFDGVFSDVAGAGRGSFNHRFAQPSRDAQPFTAVYYPTDIYPFTDLPYSDPVTSEKRGLLDRAVADKVVPRIFYTNTSYEYWSRAGSLIHTTPDGARDAEIPDNVRIYLQTGFAHISGPFPPPGATVRGLRAQLPINPLPEAHLWRALLMAMHEWVTKGTGPPASRYPRLDDGTLVALNAWKFPPIPGVKLPTGLNQAFRMDYGPEFESEGIIARQPPVVGKPFPIFVPQSDGDGNDRAGVRMPQLSVPVATYTGWNLRDPATGAAHERVSFAGSYIGFAHTRTEREQSGDPRPSLEERYRSRDEYLGRYTEAALQLIKDRFLLPEDLAGVLERGKQEWEFAAGNQPQMNRDRR